MGVEEELGSIAVGKLANFYITAPVPGIEFLPYAYGSDLVDTVYLKGKKIFENKASNPLITKI